MTMLAMIIYVGWFLLMLFIWIAGYLKLFTDNSAIKRLRRSKQWFAAKSITVNNARKIKQQINIASKIVVNNFGKNNTHDKVLTVNNDALLNDLLTNTPIQSSNNRVITRRDKVYNDVFIVNESDILDRIERGQGITKIIREVYGITAGEVWTLYNMNIRALAKQYNKTLRHNRQVAKTPEILSNADK